jgi:hypothetical protein
MNPEKQCISVYEQQIEKISARLSDLKKKKDFIAFIRVLTILSAIAIIYFLYPKGWIVALPVLVLLAMFLRLVIIATNNNTEIANHQLLLQINQEEIVIANRQFTHLPDGLSFLPASHDYANDLDIFGRASLYQYINRAKAEQGQKLVASWLLHPAATATILQRQAAAKELSQDLPWRQQLQAYGKSQPITIATQQKMQQWLSQPIQYLHAKFWKAVRIIYPVITIGSLLFYLADIVNSSLFTLLFIVYLLVSLYVTKRMTPYYDLLNKIVQEVLTLSNSVAWIEKKIFSSEGLQQLQTAFDNRKASAAILQLKNILDRFDYRLNPIVFVPLNAFLLWDLQQVFQLEEWKEKHRAHVTNWFAAVAETEALCTLAHIHYNHPNWTFPVFDTNHGTLEGNALGHPLISQEKRVTSSFRTKGMAQLALVTGSNMAGKSTFLRTIGINTVMGMMGAPVCAKSFQISPMRIISTMRISDNLEENTSTFYAELKKLKHIIEAVNNKEKVFLLLDEILRGTNSLDRHTGSKAFIKQLIEQEATGILATHDLELAKLAAQYPSHIHNYHFDVQVANDELYFDYLLKEGVCKSLNASILMKKIGIELQ